MPLKAGDRIDRYTLLAPIGEGAQGSVWRVLDPLDGGVERALKLVSTSGLSADASERARREARALAAAPHPNVIACHGLFEDVASGLVGLVLDLVDGKPLHEVADDPRLSEDHKNALLLQIVEALAHIHAVEIIHRDLKPDNVLVTEAFWANPRSSGAIKLVDFGIAVRLGNPRPLTQLGEIVGTAPYLAPEALVPSVAPEAAAGAVRDIFAFGVLAFELLTGRHPTGLAFDASPSEFVFAYARVAARKDPWPPDDLPARWRAPVAKCLSLDVADRPKSGLDLLDMMVDLEAAPSTVSASPINLGDPSAPYIDLRPSEIEVDRPPSAIELRLSEIEVDRPPSAIELRLSEIETEHPPSALPPTIPGAPAPLPKTTTPPTRKRRGWIVVVLALALLALGAAGLVLARRRGLHIPFWETPAPPIPIASAPAVVSTSHPKHPPHAPSACPALCCGGYACAARAENARGCSPEGGHCHVCASGRACVPGPCESRIASDGVFRLRLSGVTAGGKDLTHPAVCVRHPAAVEEPWVCTASASDLRFPRFRVTTAELTHEGIDLSVARPGASPAIGTRLHHPAIGVAALCRGLNFRFSAPDGVGYAVTLFLDDDEDAP